MNQQFRTEFDDLFWQRLVDGQATIAELRQLVAAGEIEPAIWKQCAVAFLEEQALTQSLKQSLSVSLDTRDTACTRESSADNWTLVGRSLEQSSRSSDSRLTTGDDAGHSATAAPLEPAKRGSETLGMGWLNLLSLAAFVLLAFGIGWQASRRVYQTTPVSIVTNNGSSSSGLPSEATGLVRAPVSNQSQSQSQSPSAGGRREILDPAQLAPQSVLVSQGPQGSSRTLTMDDRWPSELNKLSNLEVGRSYGVVPVTLDGVPALVPLERVEIRAREPY